MCRRRDIQTVGKDPDTFCSGSGVLMADRGWEIAAQDSILYLDPPSHGPYRKLVSRAFTPRRVAHLEPRIRQLAVELLDAIDPDRPVDLVDTLTAPLPLRPPGSTRPPSTSARWTWSDRCSQHGCSGSFSSWHQHQRRLPLDRSASSCRSGRGLGGRLFIAFGPDVEAACRARVASSVHLKPALQSQS